MKAHYLAIKRNPGTLNLASKASDMLNSKHIQRCQSYFHIRTAALLVLSRAGLISQKNVYILSHNFFIGAALCQLPPIMQKSCNPWVNSVNC